MRLVLLDGLHDLRQQHVRRGLIVQIERLFELHVHRPTRVTEVEPGLTKCLVKSVHHDRHDQGSERANQVGRADALRSKLSVL